MTRELYGVGSLVGREKFGLGSSLKKFVRKIIPNEVADIAVKAAPFVAPFNPAIGGAMAALGTFDQTGSIGKSVQRGLVNYGLGQGARYLGGAELQGNPFQGPAFSSPIGVERTGLGTFLRGPEVAADAYVPASTVSAPTANAPFGNLIEANAQMNLSNLPAETVAPGWRESVAKLTSGDFTKMGEGLKELGGDALKAIYTKPGEGGKPVVDKFAVAATIAGVSTFIDAKNLATEAGLVDNPEEYTEEMYNADKAKYLEQYSKALPASAFGLKDGGRVKYNQGTPNPDELPMSQEGFPKYYDEEGNEISFAEFEAGMKEPIMPRKKPEEMVKKNKLEKLLELKSNMEPEAFEMYLEKLKDELGGSGVPSIFLKEKRAKGGRIGYNEGSPDDPQGRRKGIVSINPMQEDLEEAGIGTMAATPFTAAEKSFLFRFLAGKGAGERTITMPDLYKIFKNPGKYPKDEQVLKGVIEMKMGKKEGGRIGYAGGSSYEGMLEDSLFNNPDYIETDKGIESLLSKLESASKKDKLISAKDYNDIMSKLDYVQNPADKFSDKLSYKVNPDPKTERDVERIAELQRIENRFKEQEDRMDYFDSKYLIQPGVRKDAEKILNSKEFKKWKEDSLSGDPKRKAKASANPKDDYFRAIYSELNDKDYLKEFYGIDVEKKAEGGLMDLGGNEMDLRGGGFVPIGAKEKADDVPARLSKNEFVFTADAVRAAGGGSIEKGAQKMYNTMKQLEKMV